MINSKHEVFDGQHMDRLIYKVQQKDEGREVQYLLKTRLGIAAGMIKVLKYNKGITLDGEIVRGTALVHEGQTVIVFLNCLETTPDITPEPGELDILYEDDAFIVINKPTNTVIHPTCSHQSGTLTNFLLYYWQQKGIFTDAHLVGRLDKDTTGIVVVARNGYVQEELKRQSEQGIMKKYYIAAVSPVPEFAEGIIDAPIVRDYDSIIKRKISNEGVRAVTHYKVLETCRQKHMPCAVVEFLLETGRTHQIRLHCSYMGFPIIGDTLYGSADTMNKAPHQLLHAYKIEIIHPITGEKIIFKAAPPAEWGEYAPRTLI